MIDLLSALGTPDGGLQRLSELRIGEKPATVLFFQKQGEMAVLHYETDPTVRAYVACPGPDCPSCYLSEKPKSFALLAVVDLATSQVGVLRIPEARGATTLAGQIHQMLQRTDLTDVAGRITRSGFTYTVTPCALTDHADRGQAAIQRYLAEKPSLASAFTAMTVEEMREIPRIRKLLDSLNLSASVRPSPTTGGPKPPSSGS